MKYIDPRIEAIKKKYQTPTSLKTWEDKMNFLKQIHAEIQEMREVKLNVTSDHQWNNPLNDN